jgi:Tol biopolymer transport system component
MKKGLFLLGLMLLLLSILCGCEKKEVCPGCFGDEPVDFRVIDYEPAWSPDGKWIAFDGWIPDEIKFYGIFKMDINGQEKVLFRSDVNEGDMRMPDWIDHSMIIYARYTSLFSATEIFSMDSNGKNEIRLTFNDADDYYPKFSNYKIAFTSKPRDKPHFRIWTMNADGSNLKQLTDTQAYTCDWSPDGKYIVYTDARKENGRLWIMDADGSDKRQLTFEHHFINF